jgi:SAF domain
MQTMNRQSAAAKSSVKGLSPSSGNGGGRHMKLAGVGVAVALAFGLVGGLLVARNGRTKPVVVASRFIAAGTIVTTDDVRVERIGADLQLRSLSGEQLNLVVGQVTQLPIAEGSLMVPEQLSIAVQPPAGAVLVGATLDAGAMPVPSIRFNDRVQVFSAGSQDGIAVLLSTATIWKIWSATPSQTGRMVVTLAVPEAEAAKVVGAAGANQIRLVLLPGKTGDNTTATPAATPATDASVVSPPVATGQAPAQTAVPVASEPVVPATGVGSP